MGIVFVHYREVVEHVLLLDIHAAHAVVNDHRKFIGKGRVVGDAVRDGRRHQVAVAVLVLQALAVQRGAARRAAEQKAARAHVARRPDQVADALESEHRIVDIERQHRLAVIGVRSGGGDPVGHAARFVDALLQYLPALVFLVEHQLIGILRRVELTHLREDTELAEHAFHTESARFVRDDRHHLLADIFVLDQDAEQAHECHRRGYLAVFRAL